MSRIKFLGAFALLTAVGALQARAAAPSLPPDVIAADTIAVIHVDSAQFNPDQIQLSATAILGANASKVDEPLKKFKERYDKAIAAGAQAATVVVGTPKKPEAAAGAPPADGAASAPPTENGNGIMYIQLKPDADVKAIEAMIVEDMKPEEKDKTLFDQADNVLAVHKKGQTFPVTPDAARAAIFTDALGTLGDASIQVAIVPDQATRDEMLKNADNAPKALKDAAPLIAKSKWLTLAVTFGNTPSIAGTANADSDADAKALTDTINTGLADLKAQAANPGPNAGLLALAGPLVGQLVDSLKPTQNGTQVSVTIKTETMKTVANFAAQLGLLGGAGGPPGQ